MAENRRKLTMTEVTTNYDSVGVRYDRHPQFKDIRLNTLSGGTSIYPVKLEGTEHPPLKDFVFDNVHIGAGEQPNVIMDIDFDSCFSAI